MDDYCYKSLKCTKSKTKFYRKHTAPKSKPKSNLLCPNIYLFQINYLSILILGPTERRPILSVISYARQGCRIHVQFSTYTGADCVSIFSKVDFPFEPPPNYTFVEFQLWHKIDVNKLKNDILTSSQ